MSSCCRSSIHTMARPPCGVCVCVCVCARARVCVCRVGCPSLRVCAAPSQLVLSSAKSAQKVRAKSAHFIPREIGTF